MFSNADLILWPQWFIEKSHFLKVYWTIWDAKNY